MGSNQLEIVFSCGQGEKYTPDNGFRTLVKRLRQTWSVESSRNIFANQTLSRCRLVILASCQKKFTEREFADLKQYLTRGGYLVVLLGEGGEPAAGTNLNYLLEEHGMTVNADTVIRGTFKKYFNPKEAVITDGYLQRMTVSTSQSNNQGGFLFPYGATMRVKSPAIPLLVTGGSCFPMQRPICGFYGQAAGSQGRILALSSVQIFHDAFIEKEENFTLVDRLFGLILAEKLPRVLPDESDVPESEPIFDIAEMANRVTPVLERLSDVSSDLTQVYDTAYDVPSLLKIADVLQAFRDVGVENEPLALIAPKFEGVYPQMQPAVYPPIFEDLPRPQLEMFDFNKEFVSGREKLTDVVTEHIKTGSLASYVNDIASVLSLGAQAAPPVRNGKELLEHVATHLINFKSSGWTQ